MILWRLTPRRWEASALNGVGSSLAGGRWNSKGLLAVYLSTDAATTVLETLTTFSRATAPPEGYRLLKVSYEGSSYEPPLASLPRQWDRPDDASAARAFGDAFLRANSAGLLLVPSVFLKSAINAVLNPLHPDAAHARVIGIEDFSFDPRWPLK
ncbi:MAG: RES family NAD+ phosphorylase [Nevskia sp.]|nr:RES family NAD+ phosphorylase [Nevskia sp.]